MLAGINFVGIDPADIALLALFPVLLVIRPSIIKLDRLDRTPRFLIFVFLFLYVVSATINPFNILILVFCSMFLYLLNCFLNISKAMNKIPINKINKYQ